MLLSLALRYQKHIALFLLSISFVQITIAERISYWYAPRRSAVRYSSGGALNAFTALSNVGRNGAPVAIVKREGVPATGKNKDGVFTGGPTQPESQSFSSVNSNNMVDLFSGDFSYNIPLLDVGGYPVNIAYHSGITMDEDASWVGLGWNINPGSITRNMRGVPDDFNGGTDTMKKVSSIKPNKNFGVTVGADFELFGLQAFNKNNQIAFDTVSKGITIGASLGIFHNTYNGWGVEKSINASISAGSKSFGNLSAGLSITNNSQTGISINPSLSTQYKWHNSNDDGGGGGGLGGFASYNSRTGLKTLQLGLNSNGWQKKKGENGVRSASAGFGTHSFAWPAYSPIITMPMTNTNTSVTLKVGYEVKGSHPEVFVNGYGGKEYIASGDTSVAIPVFGYLNYQNMVGNRNALSDFNREKELSYREKPAIPHIAVPSYTYDVFSISGEGTGGAFRPYRGDIGFVADHRITSKTITDAVSLDIGLGDVVHGGTDMNSNYSYTQTGPWQSENVMGETINFRNSQGLFEAAYFRNPAEKSINTTAFYDAIGGDDVVAPALSHRSWSSPTIIASNTLNRYNKKKKVGSIDLNAANAVRNTRDKRSQVISYLTAAEASVVGLDKYIYHHTINKFGSRHCDDVSVGDTLGIGTGVLGYYYPNRYLKAPYWLPIQHNRNVFFDWEKWTPYWLDKGGYPQIKIDRKFPNDNFTVRWLGRLKAPVTGIYDFGIRVDDRCRLWMNDSILIDNWRPGSGPDWTTVKVNLVKDHFYNLRIEYIELGGDGHAIMQFAWRRPDQPNRPFNRVNKDTVDGKYLYPPTFVDTAIIDEVITREDRVNNFRKSSHISEVDVLNPDGRRYVYGIPVYNIVQKETSFSVNKDGEENTQTGMTAYSGTENSTQNNSGKQGYYSRQETPAYAHSFLLTGILSPDYVDVTGNGISDDDLGDAVKFNYAKSAGIASPFEWRAPYNDSANYNEGLKTYNRDDKAHYISGKKEMWYLHTIESKTMIATFTLQHREDLLEISESGIKSNRDKAFCLKKIDLYSKADFLAHGTSATPVKTVHFEYSYELCRGINRYGNNAGNDSGKLTLKKIWFTYNGNDKGKLNPYIFYYHNNNPRYTTNANDKWGTYKDPAQNPGATTGNPLNNADYPYALQDSSLAAYNAAAWTLDSIKLPSGARIKVKYESDDYAYIQNRRAAQMMELAGFGSNTAGPNSDRLYSPTDLSLGNIDYRYVYVKVPVAVSTKQELFARYLNGMSKLYFRLFMKMPPTDKYGTGSEYVPCYAQPDTASANWYGLTSDPNVIYIKIAGVNNDGDGPGSLSPLAQAAINYLRLNLPSKAYKDSEPGDNLNALEVVRMMVPQLADVSNMLLGFNKSARLKNWVSHTTLSRSYVRLNCPSLKKLGGGLRVKSILIYDHWNAMTKKKETVFGQQYDYTTLQSVNGKDTRISSGVAAWEPVIGAEENPFHLPIEYQEKVSMLGPASGQYSEEPLGEAFFPGASVGYSKVRVRSIHTDKTRSANGYSETRFYTTYDFPTTWDWSMFDGDTKKRYKPVLRNFLRLDAKSFLSISQGFKVELNDMNGKLRSEASYGETDPVHPVSYTENFYRVDNGNVAFKHLNNVVTTIDPYGNIDTAATIGKDIELMADMRDQTSVSIGANIHLNSDMFTVAALPAVIPTLLNLAQKETTRFRSAAMTKVIYRYGIIDSVVHIEKGSKVSSENLVYDAETGDPLLIRTRNEFNDSMYQFTYPAHWVYKGVEPAYKNIGAILNHLEVRNGKIINGTNGNDSLYLAAGDELLVYSKETISTTGCTTNAFATFPDRYKLWVIDSNSVRGGEQRLFLVDKNGTPFSGNDITLKVVRSGRRNMNGAVGSVASLKSPLVRDGEGKYRLVFDTATRVISAGASEMQQYWKVADKRKSDLTKDCVPTSSDSARFEAEACSCMKPFFDYLITSQQLFVRGFGQRKTIGQLVNEANLNVSGCPILQENLNSYFSPVSADPNGSIYTCRIGNVELNLVRRRASMESFFNLTSSSCTSEGVVFKNPNVVIQQPDTVTVRIAPDFSASLLSMQNCPTFRDSLTLTDSVSDRLLVETNLDLGGFERNAIAIMRFNNIRHLPDAANILSAKLILQADQRGHHTLWPNANSVNPVDTLSISLATPGWYPKVPIDTFHSEALNSDWHKEVGRTVPFQNDTIDVKEYLEGYRNYTYASRSFILTQGSQDFHKDVSDTAGMPGYLQSGYGNYYSTYYSQRHADSAKWPVMEVTYVVLPAEPDTMGAVLRYNSTLQCTDINSALCYSAVTDTTVNPYQYGILGNYRPLRSYVYYSRRMESDPLQPVNIRTNGAIKDFAPFWILQGNRWAPSYDTTRWVWNSEITMFNRKGFELESKDPLGRYNAGIYGYGLSMPVAVLQNSHFQEGAYEGFEDYGFETNNCDNTCPVARSFDFSAYKSYLSTAQVHTGLYSLKVDKDSLYSISASLQPAADTTEAQLTSALASDACGTKFKGMLASKNTILPNFSPIPGKRVIVGGWVKEDNSCLCKGYTRNHILVGFVEGGNVTSIQLTPSGNLVEGWQRYEAVVDIPANATQMTVTLQASDSAATYFDDIRIHPYNAQMRSYVYNSVNLRLMAELDENNYASFYEYDDDGTLVRVKKETERGIQTIKESRSALLKEEQ
ncbi:hypothetical protein FAM09_12980 [Niastella caeni]|uniref:PA14 domain-containing protein n=1 Tax=Niastella caeni TaxID=2569763 RepID=A0A4S8HUY5_9BACT|nr:PA14 domain-containing protein [Niastella caeni]THU39413.1 hypothetical protein FAM09_12980 [Niastella caeni]